MEPTNESRNLKYIKAVGIDAPTKPQEDMTNVMAEVDGGILEYVRERMHCEKVTVEVRRQAVAFEREMSRMQGW